MSAKTWAKTKIFAKTVGKTKTFFEIFRENKIFLRKPSGNFRLFLIEKRGFRFNPKLTLLINMLKLHKITISESRVAEP
jgi:hypothetical protein